MQRSDRWPDDYDPDSSKSRPTSRRNSAGSRRNSLKKEKEDKTLLNSAHSTPKKQAKSAREPNFDFVVTGKPLLKKSDRANSLPGTYHRRPSCDAVKTTKGNRSADSKRLSQLHDRNEESNMSLDLSQVSDFEDVTSKYGHGRPPLATSTPKHKLTPKGRSVSVQQRNVTKVEKLRGDSSRSKDSMISCSGDSLYRTSSTASPYKYGVSTELDYSSVSPEYSGQSSTDLSPRVPMSQRGQDVNIDSYCISTCQDLSDLETQLDRDKGEWSRFWTNYNHTMRTVPMSGYYDQCPTPFRTENFDLQDLDFSTDGSRKRSPEDMQNLNNIIRNEGLHLTPRETQNIIKCAHILGNVLTKAIDRRSKENDDITKVQDLKPEIDPELEIKKKTLSLNLKETALPVKVIEEKRSETVTTQTDISLPNTKSAPRIFENILRQLSRTTLEEKKEVNKEKAETIQETEQNGDGLDTNLKEDVKKPIDDVQKTIDKSQDSTVKETKSGEVEIPLGDKEKVKTIEALVSAIDECVITDVEKEMEEKTKLNKEVNKINAEESNETQ